MHFGNKTLPVKCLVMSLIEKETKVKFGQMSLFEKNLRKNMLILNSAKYNFVLETFLLMLKNLNLKNIQKPF